MPKPKFKEGDLVRLSAGADMDAYLDNDDPLMNTIEKVRTSVYKVKTVQEFSGYYYEILHEHEPDKENYSEAEEYDLEKVVIKPPTKQEMQAVYKSLGVKFDG